MLLPVKTQVLAFSANAYFYKTISCVYCRTVSAGGSLDRYGKIPEEILGRMAVRIVQGLIYMWSLKILHRGMLFNMYLNLNVSEFLCFCGGGGNVHLSVRLFVYMSISVFITLLLLLWAESKFIGLKSTMRLTMSHPHQKGQGYTLVLKPSKAPFGSHVTYSYSPLCGMWYTVNRKISL